MQWIKEVEMVDSVGDLKSLCSVRGIQMSNFEVLDARIASALNKIIHNSHFKRKISLEEQKAQKEDRFLHGRQIAYLIYEQFRVTGTDNSVENCTDLFSIILRNDDVQEFDSKWDGILLLMTKIPSDDILEGLHKFWIRESGKLKTVLELHDLEIHQKKLGPDYQRLKTMVKRSIEQDIRSKNFGIRNGIMRRTPWSRIKEQNSVYKEFLEIVGNGKPTGSVWKETIAVSATIWISVEKLHHQIRLRILSCSRKSVNHREPEVPVEKAPAVERLDGPRITSKELAMTHPAKGGILLNVCSTRARMVAVLGRSALLHIVRLTPSRRNGPNRIMTQAPWLYWKRVIGMNESLLPTGITIAQGNLIANVAKSWDEIHRNVNLMHDNWVAHFRTWRRRSLLFGRALTCWSRSNVWNSRRLLCVTQKFETKILCSVTFVQVILMSPNAPKFEDRSQEETE